MTACPTLSTERLVLRPFVDSDLDAYSALMATPDVRRSLRLPERYSRSNAWSSMAFWQGQWELRGSGHWAVTLRSGGQLAGRAGLHRPEYPDWPGLEVGWVLHPDHRGQGLATEAGTRSIAYAFETIGVSEIFSVILPDNLPSQAVARRLGLELVEERVLSFFPAEPHGVWRLTRADWERNPA